MDELYDKNVMSSTSNHFIDISPQNALIDERISIKIRNFKPNQEITLRAQMEDCLGVASQWESYAVFITNEDGEIDVGKQKSLRGTYDCIDSMGLFWSMNLVKGPKKIMPPNILSEVNFKTETNISLSIEVDGKIISKAVIKRLYILPEIKIRAVTDNGIIGKFFCSSDTTPKPGIIVFSGSEGGIEFAQYWAALLASRGYSVLALAYFKMNGLPENLYNIPLEYFETAINWMQKQENVIADRIGIMGRSKGGELALLLGATFPQIKAVVAQTPSPVVFEGLKGMGMAKQSSWNYQGRPLPYVRFKRGNPFKMLSLLFKLMTNKPARVDFIYIESMKDAASVEKAIIKVEKINAPLLLVSAEDDIVWPSTAFCNMIVERLKKNDFKYKYKHLNYSLAGHNIRFPYLPTTHLSWNSGNPKDNAFAAQDSWIETLQFFNQSFQR